MRKKLRSKGSKGQTTNRFVILELDVELMLTLWLSEHTEFWAAIQQTEVLIKEGAVTQGNITFFLTSFLSAFLILLSKVTHC